MLTLDYKTSVSRSPRQALVSIPQTPSESTGPDFSHFEPGQFDNDLLLNFNQGGLPIGERIILAGRVVDPFDKPVTQTLVKIWQANAGGRYRHKNDRYLAPLDPNFGNSTRNQKIWNEMAKPGAPVEHILLLGNVYDGNGHLIRDSLLKFWQADSQGRYDTEYNLDKPFNSFGRTPTTFDAGKWNLHTLKPAPQEQP